MFSSTEEKNYCEARITSYNVCYTKLLRYERGGGVPPSGPGAQRDRMIQLFRDLGRSIDYLETRPDIDHGRLAYYGISSGAVLAPILTAMEPRFKASILLSGGFPMYSLPPEADPVNFASRATTPVLMVNGRQDFRLPLRTSQESYNFV